MPKKKSTTSVKERIRTFLVENAGNVVSREQIQEAARIPESGKIPENWHQRLSELRVDEGYDILSWRDRDNLKPGEYVLKSSTPSRIAKPRATLSKAERKKLFERDGFQCQWEDCKLKQGEVDPVGGGAVVLTVYAVSAHGTD